MPPGSAGRRETVDRVKSRHIAIASRPTRRGNPVISVDSMLLSGSPRRKLLAMTGYDDREMQRRRQRVVHLVQIFIRAARGSKRFSETISQTVHNCAWRSNFNSAWRPKFFLTIPGDSAKIRIQKGGRCNTLPGTAAKGGGLASYFQRK